MGPHFPNGCFLPSITYHIYRTESTKKRRHLHLPHLLPLPQGPLIGLTSAAVFGVPLLQRVPSCHMLLLAIIRGSLPTVAAISSTSTRSTRSTCSTHRSSIRAQNTLLLLVRGIIYNLLIKNATAIITSKQHIAHLLAPEVLIGEPVLPLGLDHFSLDAVDDAHGDEEIMAVGAEPLARAAEAAGRGLACC